MSTDRINLNDTKYIELEMTETSRAASYSYDTDISTPLRPSEVSKGESDLMYPIRDESEDIIIQLAKRQRKMSNYSDEENLAYSSRESLLEWCNKVLDSLELSLLEKESIFH